MAGNDRRFSNLASFDAEAIPRYAASLAEDGSFTNIQGAVFYGHRAFEDQHVVTTWMSKGREAPTATLAIISAAAAESAR